MRAGRLTLPLVRREIEYVLSLRETVFWPDEKRLVDKLQRGINSETPIEISRIQLKIIWGWLEEEMGGHLGRPVLHTELRAVVAKLEPLL